MNTDLPSQLATAFFVATGVDATQRQGLRRALMVSAPAPVGAWVKKHRRRDLLRELRFYNPTPAAAAQLTQIGARPGLTVHPG